MKGARLRRLAQLLLGVVLLAVLGLVIFMVVRAVWRELIAVNADLAIAVITGATTILAATGAIVLGRYYERAREREAHFREKKVEIYDEFLSEFFKLFYSQEQQDLVAFLREWQRKILLWGGDTVLAAYIVLVRSLRSGNPDAGAMFLTEDFFGPSERTSVYQTRACGRECFSI